jgi:hypothetical protein
MSQETHNILTSECHLHLYGCLAKETLWELSESRSKTHDKRFQWYLAEYEKATGQLINPRKWWDSEHGFAVFKNHFLCREAVPFEIFQARFNLLIALFPPNPDDMTMPERVFKAHAIEGGFKEYRTFMPLYLAIPERKRYLRKLIETAAGQATKSYQPRIAISFSRQDNEAWDNYQFLKEAIAENPSLAPWITGIDFCANERGHPPSAKRKLFKQILADNRDAAYPLEILYHVGEMWQDIAIHSAARWCVETTELGVKRLGHALALGLNAEAVNGRTIYETNEETAAHFAWLRKHRSVLHENGYTPTDYAWLERRAHVSSHNDNVTWHYDKDLIENTTKFQTAAMAIVRCGGSIIESCPTSNLRIGAIRNPVHHPLRRFLDHGLPVAISTDDPGIFDIDLGHEETLARNVLGITSDELTRSHELTESIFINLDERARRLPRC